MDICKKFEESIFVSFHWPSQEIHDEKPYQSQHFVEFPVHFGVMTNLASAYKFASENTEFNELLPSFPEQWRDECEVDGAQNLATQIEFDV